MEIRAEAQATFGNEVVLSFWTARDRKNHPHNNYNGLRYLIEEGVFENFILVSQDPESMLNDGIITMH